MFQRVEIIGYLGRDPEMRYTPGGAAVCSFSVATSQRWNDAAGVKQERTTWFRVTAWNKLAETCNQYLLKGRLVFVEGTIAAHGWQGQDGALMASLDLTARNVKFLGGGKNAGDQGESADGFAAEEGPSATEDEIPF